VGRGTAGSKLTAAALALCILLCAPFAGAASGKRNRVLRDGPFTAHFSDVIPRADVEKTLALFKDARKNLGKYFDKQFNNRLEIQIYSTTAEFTKATGYPWWIGAAWFKGQMHLQPPRVLIDRGVLATTITHEYSHVALYEAAGSKTPLWLDEGFAAHMSGEFDIDLKKDKKKFLYNGTLDQLDKSLSQTKDKKKSESAYRAAFAIVRFMHTRYGDAKMRPLLLEVGKSGKFDDALKKTLGADSASLLSEFRKNQKQK
jgi:hypothetical protein